MNGPISDYIQNYRIEKFLNTKIRMNWLKTDYSIGSRNTPSQVLCKIRIMVFFITK